MHKNMELQLVLIQEICLYLAKRPELSDHIGTFLGDLTVIFD